MTLDYSSRDFHSAFSNPAVDRDTSHTTKSDDPTIREMSEQTDGPGYSPGRGVASFTTGALSAALLQPLITKLMGVKRQKLNASKIALLSLLAGGSSLGLDYMRDIIRRGVDKPRHKKAAFATPKAAATAAEAPIGSLRVPSEPKPAPKMAQTLVPLTPFDDNAVRAIVKALNRHRQTSQQRGPQQSQSAGPSTPKPGGTATDAQTPPPADTVAGAQTAGPSTPKPGGTATDAQTPPPAGTTAGAQTPPPADVQKTAPVPPVSSPALETAKNLSQGAPAQNISGPGILGGLNRMGGGLFAAVGDLAQGAGEGGRAALFGLGKLLQGAGTGAGAAISGAGAGLGSSMRVVREALSRIFKQPRGPQQSRSEVPPATNNAAGDQPPPPKPNDTTNSPPRGQRTLWPPDDITGSSPPKPPPQLPPKSPPKPDDIAAGGQPSPPAGTAAGPTAADIAARQQRILRVYHAGQLNRRDAQRVLGYDPETGVPTNRTWGEWWAPSAEAIDKRVQNLDVITRMRNAINKSTAAGWDGGDAAPSETDVGKDQGDKHLERLMNLAMVASMFSGGGGYGGGFIPVGGQSGGFNMQGMVMPIIMREFMRLMRESNREKLKTKTKGTEA